MKHYKILCFLFVLMLVLVFGPKMGIIANAQEYGQEIWRVDLLDPIRSLAVIPDLSGDGFPDLIAGVDSGIYCIETREGVLWWSAKAPAGATVSDTVWSVAAIGDVDADGQSDVAVGTSGNEVRCFSGGAATGIGVEIWSRPPDLGGDVWSLSSFPDMDDDTYPEVLAGTAANAVHLLNGEDGAIVWSYSVGGDVRAVSPIPDVSGDGKPDVLAGAGDGVVYCINGATGQLLWRYGGLASVWTIEPFYDMDGDGRVEAMVGTGDNRVLCLSGAPSPSGPDRIIWSFSTDGDVRGLTAMPDMTGDGRPEAAAGSADDRLYLLNGYTGEAVWNRNLNGEVFSLAPVRDFTRDGQPEIAAGGALSAVFCQSGEDGTDLWYYPFADIGEIRHIASIPDMGADGVEEIAAASANGTLRLLSGSAGLGAAHFDGDADCNHDVNLADVVTVLRIMAGLPAGPSPLPEGCVPGDSDGNGRAELSDAVFSMTIAAGIQ